jgi:hypothetical protein
MEVVDLDKRTLVPKRVDLADVRCLVDEIAERLGRAFQVSAEFELREFLVEGRNETGHKSSLRHVSTSRL